MSKLEGLDPHAALYDLAANLLAGDHVDRATANEIMDANLKVCRQKQADAIKPGDHVAVAAKSGTGRRWWKDVEKVDGQSIRLAPHTFGGKREWILASQVLGVRRARK